MIDGDNNRRLITFYPYLINQNVLNNFTWLKLHLQLAPDIDGIGGETWKNDLVSKFRLEC